MERTFIMVKPDGVQRGLVGEVIQRFERRGYKLVAIKMMHASEQLLQIHYEALKSLPFFPKLVAYMSSGPVVPMVFEGRKVTHMNLRCTWSLRRTATIDVQLMPIGD
ncbi:unnamed protein product [Schistosoma margrebowiei]|uniref:nucleoside-diphosphate kinase n=1 Tax=Schistosoma margrebowiei TaxID=48269 RepID=A0A183N8B2_9TREM|nr:unnamed protein product [Schistosoma margrebowiei]